MPLHLLPKKSWNVYNADNVERVRRDEEIARSKEEEEEMKMQQEDAERRMMELRRRALEQQGRITTGVGGGGGVGGAGGGELLPGGVDRSSVSGEMSMDLDRRTLVGSNEFKGKDPSNAIGTAREIRGTAAAPYTREREGYIEGSSVDPQVHKSLTDKSGHINFFSEPPSGPRKLSTGEKNPEYEKEKAEKEAKIAEQYNMALGKPAEELRPWYVSVDKVGEKRGKRTQEQVKIEKRRDERFKDLNDPMAMMKRGVRQLKEVEEVRKKVEEVRKYELEILKKEQEELEGFSLDGLPETRDHSLRPRRDISRSGVLGTTQTWRSRSRSHGPDKHRRRGRSGSPEGSFDIGHRRRRDEGGSRLKDRDRRRSRDRSSHRQSGHRHHRSREGEGKERTQDGERRSGRTEDRDKQVRDQGHKRKEHHERGKPERDRGSRNHTRN